MEELYTDIVNGLAKIDGNLQECYDELIELSEQVGDDERLAYTMLVELFKGLVDMTADDWITFFRLPMMNWVGNYSMEELKEAMPRLVHYSHMLTTGMEQAMEENAAEITEEKETEAAE